MSASLKAKAYSQARTELRLCEEPSRKNRQPFGGSTDIARGFSLDAGRMGTDGDTSFGCAISPDGGLVCAREWTDRLFTAKDQRLSLAFALAGGTERDKDLGTERGDFLCVCNEHAVGIARRNWRSAGRGSRCRSWRP